MLYQVSLGDFSLKSMPTTQTVEEPVDKSSESLETKSKESVDTILRAFETLTLLKNTQVPENNPLEIAVRLDGLSLPADYYKTAAPIEYKIGDVRDFWVLNITSNQYQSITASLEFISAHLYFWVQKGVDFERNELIKLGKTFEDQIYPTNRNYFGSEPTPGINYDPHLYILYTNGMGNAAGYFSSSDTLPIFIDQYSNVAEMFYISASCKLHQDYTYGVLAHEFQHMIHWNLDRNETSWINEGFSELAVLLNGYDVGGFDYLYAINPDIQLNDWPGDDQGNSSPHYGASFLFMTYFLHRFGDEITQALVRHPENCLEGIDAVLAESGIAGEDSQIPITADEIFQDWVITNYVHKNYWNEDLYTYGGLWSAPYFRPTESLDCMSERIFRDVNQYGVDYIRLNCEDDSLLEFEGENFTSILPVDPFSGLYYFWSNKGDESDMKLTKRFDLRTYQTPIEMHFQVWYDIEKDYDYVYLLVSEDNGETWEIVETNLCTTENPTGANYGCGYNGKSDGWLSDSLDLSAYVGKEILVQFEYITDLAVNGEGFVVDDIRIDAIDYYADFELSNDGWEAEGFVRISNTLPQTYKIALIQKRGENFIIEKIDLDKNNTASLRLPYHNEYEETILVVSGITRFTRIPTQYSVTLKKD